jgi:membrane protein insertase Oxa1/YidC/SpoIIIJ
MKFSDYCDIIENTEEEQQMFQYMKQDEDIKSLKEALPKIKRIPFFGKLFTALVAMEEYESIAEFKESEHYKHLMNWSITFDSEAGNMSITATNEQQQKAKNVIVPIVVAVILLVMCVKCWRRKKKSKKK